MQPDKQQTTYFQQAFSSFEIFSTVLRGYDIDLQQLDKGSFSANLQQIQCGSVFINRFTTTRRLEIYGNPPLDLLTFGIPTNNCLPFTWRNQLSDGNTIQIYHSNTELEMNTHPFFEAVDVSIPADFFNKLLQQWELPTFEEMIGNKEMVSCDPVRLHQLRVRLCAVCDVLDQAAESLNQNAELQNIIQYEIPFLLAQALLFSENNVIKPRISKRTNVLQTAIEHIKNTPHNTGSIHQLCKEKGINGRTLQRAFHDRYGISPKSYVLATKLNNVYKTLTNSNVMNTNVKEVADNFGFRHLSQFAKDYHQHFGELPSDTLKLEIN